MNADGAKPGAGKQGESNIAIARHDYSALMSETACK
jgi:hypothetical protein